MKSYRGVIPAGQMRRCRVAVPPRHGRELRVLAKDTDKNVIATYRGALPRKCHLLARPTELAVIPGGDVQVTELRVLEGDLPTTLPEITAPDDLDVRIEHVDAHLLRLEVRARRVRAGRLLPIAAGGRHEVVVTWPDTTSVQVTVRVADRMPIHPREFILARNDGATEINVALETNVVEATARTRRAERRLSTRIVTDPVDGGRRLLVTVPNGEIACAGIDVVVREGERRLICPLEFHTTKEKARR